MPTTKELRNSALKLLKENVKIKSGEKILLVTDRHGCKISHSIIEAASTLGINTGIARISSKRAHSSPIPELAAAFRSADVIIAPTYKSISHSPQTRIARKKNGVRVVSMPGITEDMFVQSFSTPVAKQKKINKKFITAFHGKKVCIASKSGTDLQIGIKNQLFKSDDGDCTTRGRLINLPSGEIDTAPISTIDGTLVIDALSGIKNASYLINIKKGRIVGFDKKAKNFVSHLKQHGDCALRTVEFGIGTNPNHKKPTGNILHDEKILGSIHIAFGGYGNLRRCPIHEDVIVIHPMIKIDGKIFMKNGRVMK
ncbi:MAG: aminopeptidase [Candidatus Aenigmarchaeota archaeon]|nr:aminopeptidase [Candidatus Aenigmarchaeota archaeon]